MSELLPSQDIQNTKETLQSSLEGKTKDYSRDFGINKEMISKIFENKVLEEKYNQLDDTKKQAIQAKIGILDPGFDDIGAYKDVFNRFFDNGLKNGDEEMKKKLDESNEKKKENLTVLDQRITNKKETVAVKSKENQQIEEIKEKVATCRSIANKIQVDNLPTYTFTDEQKQKLQQLNISEKSYSKLVYVSTNPSLITDQEDRKTFQESYKNIEQFVGQPKIAPTLSSFSNPEAIKNLAKQEDQPQLKSYLQNKENTLTFANQMPTTIQEDLNTQINALKISEFSSLFGKLIGPQNMNLLNLKPTEIGENFKSTISINGNEGQLSIKDDGQLTMESTGLRPTHLGNIPSMKQLETTMQSTLDEIKQKPDLPQDPEKFLKYTKEQITTSFTEKTKNLINTQESIPLERALTKLSVKKDLYTPWTEKQGLIQNPDSMGIDPEAQQFSNITNNTLDRASTTEIKTYQQSLKDLSTHITNPILMGNKDATPPRTDLPHPFYDILSQFQEPRTINTITKTDKESIKNKQKGLLQFINLFTESKTLPGKPQSVQVINVFKFKQFTDMISNIKGKSEKEIAHQTHLINPKVATAYEQSTNPPFTLDLSTI